ncbi:hypothetical protein H4R34_002647 [Dimargaris verticillata]|uniref:SMAD/FHA domain-containing protein n=1 Tax=Dimargaris verticillata TaxID=2761393 RepID=A0A9W8B2D9_9FUNG|nr:hypothetical protein H4R34_002647 [Dimargaris verticillata]
MSRPPAPPNGETAAVEEGNASITPATVPHIRFAPHIQDVRHSLYFEAIDRDVPSDCILKIGRFTDRVSQQPNRIAFKSKVVSRSHAEIWSENGMLFIRDTKSSSGTFLNHVRLSLAGVESPPKQLHDGDILQLGVDYQGGIQEIYKCVRIRLEINRHWQRQAENPYRMRVMKNLQNMFTSFNTADGPATDDRHECCICLYAMGPFQALFVAPCSHCFHFKCIKPIIFTTTGFSCPLCRTFADLEAPVDEYENELNSRVVEKVETPAIEDSRDSPVEPLPAPPSAMMDIDSTSTPQRALPVANGSLIPGALADDATPIPVSATTVRITHGEAPSAGHSAHPTSDEESTPGHSLSRDLTAHGVRPPASEHSPTHQVTGNLSMMALSPDPAAAPPLSGPEDSESVTSDAAFFSEDSMHHDPPQSGNEQTPPAINNGQGTAPFPRTLAATAAGSRGARVGVESHPTSPLTTGVASSNHLAPPQLMRVASRRRAQSCVTEPTTLEECPDSPMTRTFAENLHTERPGTTATREILHPMQHGNLLARDLSSGPRTAIPSALATIAQRAVSVGVPAASMLRQTTAAVTSSQTVGGDGISPTTRSLGMFGRIRRRLSDHSEYYQTHRTVPSSPVTATASPLASVLNHLRHLGSMGMEGQAQGLLHPTVEEGCVSNSGTDGRLQTIPTHQMPVYHHDGQVLYSSVPAPGLAGSPGQCSAMSFPLGSTSPTSSMGDVSEQSAPMSTSSAARCEATGPRVGPHDTPNPSSWVTDDTEEDGAQQSDGRKRISHPAAAHSFPIPASARPQSSMGSSSCQSPVGSPPTVTHPITNLNAEDAVPTAPGALPTNAVNRS